MADEVHDSSLLLIEDNDWDADLFHEHLIDYPYRHFHITRATCLEQALSMLAAGPSDLIVSDLILPDSSGIATIVRIHDAAPRTPVVVLSGIADDQLGQRAIQAGAQDFLHKNALDSASLARSLRYALERGRLQSQFRSLVENNADAIVVVNRQGTVRYINRAAELFYGRGKDDLVGQRFGFAIESDAMTEIEVRSAEGEKRAGEMRAALIDWDGESAWLASIRDITDRRRAEELQRRLVHADRLASIGQLASGVAHEVNNPATFIHGNTEILQEDLGQIRQILSELRSLFTGRGDTVAGNVEVRRFDEVLERHDLDEILEEMDTMLVHNRIGIQRISKIVKALGSFSRIERDEVELVDLNEIIDGACSMTFNEIRHRAALQRDLNPLPPIMGDRGKLAQVFTNLLINAAHAIEPGAAEQNRIRVVTRVTGNEVIGAVEDTGCGISRADLDCIFKPFFTTKPRGQGTGLGLSLSADIVEKHNGQLRVTSTVGEGTRFEVALPLCLPEQSPVPAPVQATGRREATPAGVERRARILVIDDEHMLLDSLDRMLRHDHDVVVADDGMAGITRLEESPEFDVLICDLMMPDVDGIEFYGVVRQRWPELLERIVFCSGGAFTDRAKDFIGMVRKTHIFIEKPIERGSLLDAVATVIAKHGSRRGGA